MMVKNEEYVSAMVRAAKEPNETIREVLVRAICGIGVDFLGSSKDKFPVLPKSKTVGSNGGRTKYMPKEEQLKVRLGLKGKTMRYDNGAVYEIVGAKWNQFILQYKSGAENDPKLEAYKSATCMRAIQRVENPKVKYANLRKFTIDGETVQIVSEGLGLVHNPYVKKN